MKRLLVVAIFLSIGWAAASADTYVQPPDAASEILSTEFTNAQQYSAYCMDDIAVTGGGWSITAISVWGTTYTSTGLPAIDTPINIRFSSNHSWTAPGTTFASQTTPNVSVSTGITTVSGLSIDLAPGHYWMSIWMTTLDDSGWFWAPTVPTQPYGDPAYVQNPGGGHGLGTDPMTVESLIVPWRDLALRITYNPVPETSTVFVVAAGIFFFRLRRV